MSDALKEEIIKHADQLVPIINSAVHPQGNNITRAATIN